MKAKLFLALGAAGVLAYGPIAFSQPGAHEPNPHAKDVASHWTAERRAAAIPRDLVKDRAGRGYLRKPNGQLVPYGQHIAELKASEPTQQAKPTHPGGANDTTAPQISSMSPADGAVIGSSETFSATITDASGIKSVKFEVNSADGVTTQSYSPSYVGNDHWETTVQGLADGTWQWRVVAKDGAKRGGNTAQSPFVGFTVDSGGGSSGGGSTNYVVTNQAWNFGGAVQTAAGRLYFEMPANSSRTSWSGYVCSGTVATDSTTGRSVIITAAHCVYDDANKAFARNVLFIPDQDGTTGSGTDLNCDNDPMGCWVPSFGVVDANYASRQFPDNSAWDYAYYVVSDSGAHVGAGAPSPSLDISAGALPVSFTTPYFNDGVNAADSVDFTHALGYSYSEDPNFMYCAEDMTTVGSVNWWLSSCGLTGGSSGGPWVQPMNESQGSGPIISVNSWGYTNSPGMAGPKLAGTSAACLFTEAKGISFASIPSADGDQGTAINYCSP